MSTAKIKSSSEAIGEFIDSIRTTVINKVFNDELSDIVEYALSELLNNAEEHGNGFLPDKWITVEWGIRDDLYFFSVEDEGDGFTLSVPKTPPCIDNNRGRGLWMISMDCVDIVQEGAKGNKIVVTWELMNRTVALESNDLSMTILSTKGGTNHERVRKLTYAIADVDTEAGGILVMDVSNIRVFSSLLYGHIGELSNSLKAIYIVGANIDTRNKLKLIGVAEKIILRETVGEALRCIEDEQTLKSVTP